MLTAASFLGDQTSVPPPPGRYVTVSNYTAYPYSRSHIYIIGPKVTDELDFNVSFFTDAYNINLKKQI